MAPDTTLYSPKAALVVFTAGSSASPYIEYYDMDESGLPVNPHPLTVREAQSLAKVLDTRGQAGKAFLRPEGLLPAHILHINPSDNGSVVWYTKAQPQLLYFAESLGIESGMVQLPSLVWRATKSELQIFALASKAKPKEATPLCNAPFFNMYRKGFVCMGTVDVRIRAAATLEEFITAWQGYFFGSYFSHHIDNHNPVAKNLISLYSELVQSGNPFPCNTLTKTSLTLKDLL